MSYVIVENISAWRSTIPRDKSVLTNANTSVRWVVRIDVHFTMLVNKELNLLYMSINYSYKIKLNLI